MSDRSRHDNPKGNVGDIKKLKERLTQIEMQQPILIREMQGDFKTDT